LILALLVLALATIASLIVTYLASLGVMTGNHIVWALLSVPLGLFTMTMHLFYFIGTGSGMRALLKKGKGDENELREIVDQIRFLRKRAFPGIFLAIFILMATFIVGGMAGVGMTPPGVHMILSTIAIPAVSVSLAQAHLMARRNFFLLLRVASITGA